MNILFLLFACAAPADDEVRIILTDSNTDSDTDADADTDADSDADADTDTDADADTVEVEVRRCDDMGTVPGWTFFCQDFGDYLKVNAQSGDSWAVTLNTNESACYVRDIFSVPAEEIEAIMWVDASSGNRGCDGYYYK